MFQRRKKIVSLINNIYQQKTEFLIKKLNEVK